MLRPMKRQSDWRKSTATERVVSDLTGRIRLGPVYGGAPALYLQYIGTALERGGVRRDEAANLVIPHATIHTANRAPSAGVPQYHSDYSALIRSVVNIGGRLTGELQDHEQQDVIVTEGRFPSPDELRGQYGGSITGVGYIALHPDKVTRIGFADLAAGTRIEVPIDLDLVGYALDHAPVTPLTT